MSARSIVLIAVALLLVVGTVFVARAWLDSQRQIAAPAPQPQKVEAVRVLVAEVALPAGTVRLTSAPLVDGKLPGNATAWITT